MKPRKVAVMLELMTDLPIKKIKHDLKFTFGPAVKQVQINVVQKED